MVANKFEQEPNLSYVRINPHTKVFKRPGDSADESTRGYITKGLSPSDKNVMNAQLLHKSLTEQAPPPPRTEFYGDISAVVQQPRPKIKVSINAQKRENSTNNNSVKIRKIMNANGNIQRIQVTVGTSQSAEDSETLASQNRQLREQNETLRKRNKELEDKVKMYLEILTSPSKLSNVQKFLSERSHQPK